MKFEGVRDAQAKRTSHDELSKISNFYESKLTAPAEVKPAEKPKESAAPQEKKVEEEATPTFFKDENLYK